MRAPQTALAWVLVAACLAPAAAATVADTAADPAFGLAPPAGCGLLWQLSVRLDTLPRHLLVEMSFDAGARTRSTLRLPSGWAGVVELAVPSAADGATNAASAANPPARLQAVAAAPALRSVAHATGERVHLRWRLTPPADPAAGGSVQLFEDWFALAGQGVLPVPEEIDERNPPTACIVLIGRFGGDLAGLASPPASSPVAIVPAPPPRWASSQGLTQYS